MERHEVPTHLDVEDRLFWGLTMPPLFGVLATLGTAYGLYARVPWEAFGLGESAVRWAAPATVAVLGIGLFVLRPGGRPVASWLAHAIAFVLRPRRFTGSVFPGEEESERDADCHRCSGQDEGRE